MEQQTVYKLGKEYIKAVYCDSAYLTNMQSTSCESTEYIRVHPARLEEALAGIKIAGRNINNLRYADDTTFMAEAKKN